MGKPIEEDDTLHSCLWGHSVSAFNPSCLARSSVAPGNRLQFLVHLPWSRAAVFVILHVCVVEAPRVNPGRTCTKRGQSRKRPWTTLLDPGGVGAMAGLENRGPAGWVPGCPLRWVTLQRDVAEQHWLQRITLVQTLAREKTVCMCGYTGFMFIDTCLETSSPDWCVQPQGRAAFNV